MAISPSIEKAAADHRHAQVAAQLLEATFPEWERESMESFWADLNAGRGLGLWLLTNDTDEFLGFARGCTLPRISRGWIVHLALDPAHRGQGLGETFLSLLQARMREEISNLEGIYFEVERIEDAVSDPERELREKRLAFFDRLGARLVSSEYIQPSSQPGQPPVPLNLLFWGETEATDEELLADFYREAFGDTIST